MTRFDFSPLFRSAIGFDHLESMLDQIDRAAAQGNSYPPYNIEKHDEHSYRITMAVAGFSQEDLDITAQENTLIIRGEKQNAQEDKSTAYLHRGIATRSFEQRFKLADFVEVKNASLEHGMLHIDLVREVPERMKPRQIEIKHSEGLLERVKKLSHNKAESKKAA